MESHILKPRLVTGFRAGDLRGWFEKIYAGEPNGNGAAFALRQLNRSFTAVKGTVRGMHAQRFPYADMKIVVCLSGIVYDTCLDVRLGSSTFKNACSFELQAEQTEALIVPPGWAHGFQTLTDNCELLYLHDQTYRPEYEARFNPLDPALDLNWPLDVTVLSNEDRRATLIGSNFAGILT